MANSENPAGLKAGSHLFAIPEKRVCIYLSLDVVDRLQQDVMRGFGAVPKRGAEIGGILLGSVSRADRLVINVEDYEMAPIEYKRGPSYLLSPADSESFQAILDRLKTGGDPDLTPIGFFRSHTRDAPALVPDDLDLLKRLFPGPDVIVLLIKPYATRVSTATFLMREDGEFPTSAPVLEFPFRRKDLAPGDDTPPKRPRMPADGLPQLSRGGAARPADGAELARFESHPHGRSRGSDRPASDPGYIDVPESDRSQQTEPAQSGWVWVPLSFIFLLLGVLLGFQAALTLRPQAAADSADPFNLQLNVSKDGDNLNVHWDRQARAIRTANRGVLVIVDGVYNKTVELDPNQLQTGTVVYRHNSSEVRFRLEVHLRERDTIIETVDWKQ